MNQFTYSPIKVFSVLIILIFFFTGNMSGQINNTADFRINSRIKQYKLYLGFEQIKYKQDKDAGIFDFDLRGYFHGGITHLNYSSIHPYTRLSFRQMAGLSYNPAFNIAGVRLNTGISIVGISARINLSYHTNFKDQSVIFKPAIGLDIANITIHWGPNIKLVHGLDKHFQRTNFSIEFSGYL